MKSQFAGLKLIALKLPLKDLARLFFEAAKSAVFVVAELALIDVAIKVELLISIVEAEGAIVTEFY